MDHVFIPSQPTFLKSMSKLKLWHDSEIKGWTKKVFDNVYYKRCESISDCDYILAPDTFTTNYHYQNLSWLKDIYVKSLETGKPYVAFLHDDPTMPMVENGIDYTSNGILFRTSFMKSNKSINEYSLPSFDKQVYEPFRPVNSDKIEIGFIGAITHPERIRSINILNDNPEISTKFIVRNGFHLHYPIEKQTAHEKEFLDNMESCAYQLCIRGAGNFSHRFYETLMYGRIPVIIDTDIPLPCSDIIDWNNFIVIAKSAEELPEKITIFNFMHNIITSQKACRLLWEKCLSPNGFASYVQNILEKNLVNE